MRPLFALLADGEDVTPIIADRLVSLTLVDEAGIKADRLRLAIDDRDNRVALPPHQAELSVSLGYLETGLTPMGRFKVDETGGGGPPWTLTIGATAADMSGEIRAPKTRGWRETTLGDVVELIAAEAGLQPAVASDLATTPYPYFAQQSESDLNLITRLAADLDAIAKAADGRLVVARRGAGQASDGTELPAAPILKSDIEELRFSFGDRGLYKSARAEWQDLATGELRAITVGDGSPVLRVRSVQDSQEAASRVAQAALDRALRGEGTLDVSCARFRPDLVAGGRLTLIDLRPELQGVWEITSVRHELRQSLVTRVSAERARAGEA